MPGGSVRQETDKRFTHWKVNRETVVIHKQYGHVQKKPKRNYKKKTPLELINKISGYKVNMQKSIVFLHTSSEQLDNGL